MKLLLIRSARLRRALGILIPFVLAPAAVLWFALGPGRGHYALSSLLMTLLALLLFSCGFERRKTGSLVAFGTGEACTYGLYNAQERGQLFIGPGVEVYAGLVVGI